MASLLAEAANTTRGAISDWVWDTLIDPCVDDLPACDGR